MKSEDIEDLLPEDFENGAVKEEIRKTYRVKEAAQILFDNHSGWSDNKKGFYAPRELWHKLGAALYGRKDDRVKELL